MIFRPQVSFSPTGYSPGGIQKGISMGKSRKKKSKGTLSREGSHPRKQRREHRAHLRVLVKTLRARKELCVAGEVQIRCFLPVLCNKKSPSLTLLPGNDLAATLTAHQISKQIKVLWGLFISWREKKKKPKQRHNCLVRRQGSQLVVLLHVKGLCVSQR